MRNRTSLALFILCCFSIAACSATHEADADDPGERGEPTPNGADGGYYDTDGGHYPAVPDGPDSGPHEPPIRCISGCGMTAETMPARFEGSRQVCPDGSVATEELDCTRACDPAYHTTRAALYAAESSHLGFPREDTTAEVIDVTPTANGELIVLSAGADQVALELPRSLGVEVGQELDLRLGTIGVTLLRDEVEIGFVAMSVSPDVSGRVPETVDIGFTQISFEESCLIVEPHPLGYTYSCVPHIYHFYSLLMDDDSGSVAVEPGRAAEVVLNGRRAVVLNKRVVRRGIGLGAACSDAESPTLAFAISFLE